MGIAVVLGWRTVAPAAGRHRAPRVPVAPLVDSDGDWLPDEWELNGVVVPTPAGPRWIDLPAMGADPQKPDIFLHVDWMADATHDQRPDPAALQLVVDAFARSPYRSPTGSVGIALHIDAGPESPLASGRPWGELSRAAAVPWKDNLGTFAGGSYDWKPFFRVKNRPNGFLASGRAAVFHYALFAHYHDRDNPDGAGASGISRGIGGTDLLLSLGNFTDGTGTPREQAGTLMHELGHNLGLRHGGCDDADFKPGYESVMNYTFQMGGLTRDGEADVLDFSRGVALEDEARDGRGRTDRGASLDAAKVHSGIAGGPATTTGGHGKRSPSCAGISAWDDWRAIRLKVGAIGDPGVPLRGAAH